MNQLVIADASCLIALHRIGSLNLLKQLFIEVVTTREVSKEFGEPLPAWISIKSVQEKSSIVKLHQELDLGESTAIALALENLCDSLLIIDERKGRKIAASLGIRIIGALGILLLAKHRNLIPSVKEKWIELNSNRFRFSQAVLDKIFRQANEM